MSSINHLLFLSLQQRIESITTDGAKTIRFIDHDLGFLDEDIPELSYPAVLIDLNGFTFTNMGSNVQMGVGTVRLRLIFAPYSGSSNIVPNQFREKGIKYYNIEQQLHTYLQGWSPSYIAGGEEQINQDIFGYLNRKATRSENARKDIRIRTLDYELAFEDYSTKTVQLFAPAPELIVDDDLLLGEIIDL